MLITEVHQHQALSTERYDWIKGSPITTRATVYAWSPGIGGIKRPHQQEAEDAVRRTRLAHERDDLIAKARLTNDGFRGVIQTFMYQPGSLGWREYEAHEPQGSKYAKIQVWLEGR